MRLLQARGFLAPPRIHCPTCSMYAWDMRIMQPVYAGSEPHHPSCPKVRGAVEMVPRGPVTAVGMARVAGARVGTWEDDQKLAYSTGFSQGYVDGKLGKVAAKDPAGEKGAAVVIDTGTQLAFNSGYSAGYTQGSEEFAKDKGSTGSPSTPAAPAKPDAVVKVNKWGPFADQKEAVLAAMATVRAVLPAANDNLVDVITGIGLAESEFGLTFPWRLPSGLPSYNWGALHRGGAPCTQEMVFVRNDNDAKGKPQQVQFAAFSSMAAGLSCFLKIWSNNVVQSAASEGNATNVAAAMYARRYFAGCGKKCGTDCCGNNEERILEYARMLQGGAARVASIAGRGTKVYVGDTVPANWRNLTITMNPSAPFPGDDAGGEGGVSPVTTGGLGLLVGVGIGAGALFLLAKRGKVTI